VRAAGHSLTTALLKEWSPSNDSEESFTKDPPNATISVFSKDGSQVRDAVVVLKTAKLDGDRLTFDVDVLEGELTGGDGPAALFIDRFGFGGFHAGGFQCARDPAGVFTHILMAVAALDPMFALGAWLLLRRPPLHSTAGTPSL
jgi:hypothetical protein